MRFSPCLVLIPFAMFATVAHAAYACVGTVTTSTVRGETLIGEFSYSPNSTTYLCILTSTAPNGVTADQCKNVYSMLLAAQLSGKSVQMWYNDSLTCATQPSWAWTSGWYHGPRLLD